MTADSYDLVVIGCGAAGLSAALAYLEAADSARVAVLERAPEAERGGASRWTTSRMRVDAEGRLDPTFAEVVLASNPEAEEYCRALEREAPTTIRLLKEHGVELEHAPVPWANELERGWEAAPRGGGKEIVDALASAVEGFAGATMLYETDAVELATEDGRVTGVAVRGPDGEQRTLAAPAVVIAAGGYEGSRELMREHSGPRGGELPLIAPGVGYNRGDGLRMALAVGASTAGQFDMFHAEPVDSRTTHPDAVVFGTPFGIVVNRDALRFWDEGKRTFEAGFESFAFEIWANQGQQAYFVGDQKTLAVPYFEFLNTTDRPPETADTVGGLAEKLGLDPAQLEATIDGYNAATRDAEFDPTRKDGKATVGLDPPKSNWACPIDSPPYFGYPLTSAICFTFGGIRTDAKARVVAESGEPIPGLYAAGEVTGLFHGEYPVGTSVLRSLAFGRLAGAHAARVAVEALA